MVFIPGVTGDDFFHTIWLGAQAEAKTLHVSIEQQAPPKYEPASQIPIVNAAIAKHPDAITVAATDAEALQAPLEQAAQRGIKVVTFDTIDQRPELRRDPRVERHRRGRSQIVAEQLVTLTGGQGKLMYIDHAPGVNFAQDLRQGFTGHGRRARARPAADPVLRPRAAEGEHDHADHASPRIRISPARSWASRFGSQGAIPALESAGKLDQVKTVAFDAFVHNMKMLEAGRLDSVVSVAAREYGTATVKAAVDALNGKTVPKKIQPKICVFTAENVDDPENEPCLYSRAPQ